MMAAEGARGQAGEEAAGAERLPNSSPGATQAAAPSDALELAAVRYRVERKKLMKAVIMLLQVYVRDD